MPITFVEPQPYELWSLKEPTATAVNGAVEVILTVCADGAPLPAAERQVVLYLELEDAKHPRQIARQRP